VGLGGAVLLGGLGSMFVWLAVGLKRVRFDVDADALRIRAPLYGRTIARDLLALDQAQVLDGAAFRDERFGRSNGVYLPGYQIGWYKSRAGVRALLFVSDPRQVLRIPTSKGYALWLSSDDPGALLAALRGA
jgi:hypothetical protein